ncbi:MAG: hypothetical protein SVS15_08745 [Thermodesulfobacteriota bacterium]|nr:hypothetical protein [Thermodesulfobacteriota bacterium]
MQRERETLYREQSTDFGPRETGLSWVFSLSGDKVFQAVTQAVQRQGLKPVLISQKYGLLIAKPRFSLLNVGRRVTISFSKTASGQILVSARYTHGLLSFQGKLGRLEVLESVFRRAGLFLDTVVDAKGMGGSVAGKSAVPPPQAEAGMKRAEEPPLEKPKAPAQPVRPRRDASGRDFVGMNGLDFGSLDWHEIPLERPSPEDFWKYRGAGKRASVRRLPVKWKMFWFGVGVVLVFLFFAVTVLFDL